ncbi:uncharacterized protein LOC142506179 [Primulina tabacum]|uniref:uncharacterized protein LOC142506179 n=1 Tax=Primulina tabacum TaxID=48773 RepID=UPI003F5A1778
MSAFVLVAGEFIELDDAMIDGALNLMTLKCGNNLDQETTTRFEQLKRMVAEKSKDESQGIKPRIKVTVPNKSRCEGSPKRKILKLDQPASTSGAKPCPSSKAFGIQPSTSRDEPGPSSGALDQHASTSRARTGPSSRELDQPASTSRARPGPSSRAFGIQPSTSRVEHGPSSGASDQPASTSSARLDPSLPPRIQDLIGLCSMPIRKKITASDVSPSQCRLMLPRVQMEELFKHIKLKPNENIKSGIPVKVYGPDGRKYAMNFTVWVGKKSYVINTRSWIQFCQDYQLRKLINMATLTIRMFRHRQTDDLCFAITM